MYYSPRHCWWQDDMLLTEVLEVDPDLVHPPGEGAAEHHAGRPVEAHPLELCPALLAVAGDLAHADLVADHLHRLAALRLAPETQRSEQSITRRDVRDFRMMGLSLHIVRNKRVWLMRGENGR